MRDTFRCSNMLLRKSLEAPTHKLRHAHKYKLFMTCPSAVGPMYSEAVSPLPQQCQNQDLQGTRAMGREGRPLTLLFEIGVGVEEIIAREN